MTLVYLVCLSFLQLSGLTEGLAVVSPPPLNCGRASEACRDGSQCVLHSHVCDGDPDCRDGSDEQNCASNCTEAQFQCGHGRRCIDQAQVCDGEAQCQDRSDELYCSSGGDGCVHPCDNKSRCLPANFLCDGERDCLDGTDEAACEDKEDEVTYKDASPLTPSARPSAPRRCSFSSKPCKDNSQCVSYEHFCDGEVDCRDQSDEADCQTECLKGQFQCEHGRRCIDQAQVCDGTPQCQDRSDEQDCSQPMEGCAHQCDDRSRCVPSSFLCDGERDCQDGTDELDCAAEECGADEFRCSSGQCVAALMRCDGHPDCPDQSDEDQCAKPPVCLTKQRCPHSRECLVQEWICDGEPDCRDGSDEKDCPVTPVSCGDFQWACKSKTKCVPASWMCDGSRDCEDGSDERDCEGERCGPQQFQCGGGGGGGCLDLTLVCDGARDCADGSDEGGKCQDSAKCTAEDYQSCSQTCLSTPQGPRCSCARGYRLQEDGVSCADVDECEEQRPVCSHICRNSPGSFTCDCHPGYVMEPDGRRCKVTEEPLLLASVLNDLFVVALRSGSVSLLPSSAKKAILSVDYDWSERRVYWDSLDSESIRWSSLDRKATGTLLRAAEECGADEFRCSSGQCVAALMRCDGHPDCPDQSDEDQCAKPPVCLTKQRCPHSRECLVQEWICDGEPDCRDGSDEKDCPVTPVSCGDFQWACKSKTKCVPASWMCDGSRDCEDGSDERDCEGERCGPQQFQCGGGGGGGCLDLTLVCDGARDCADGSDEGGKCQDSAKCTAEDYQSCSQTCLSTPQGPRCSCARGYRLQEDGVSCADVDECEEQRPVCSHICRNSPGSFTCDCHPGYVMEPDGRRCKVTEEPLLLASVLNDLFVVALRSGSVSLLPSSAKKAILSVDYDWSERRVYWDSLDSESIRWSSLDRKATGTLLRGVRADSVAVDWLGRNLYWIDGVNSQIFAAQLPSGAETRPDFTVILDEDLDQPRSLALLPQKGLMFWTEIGSAVKIERAGMDGSERRALVTSSLGWPVGVAVDSISNRVYWTDQRLRAIGSASLDGDDIQILQMKETANPFSLAVFDDVLYWSDTKRRVVQVAHKLTGKNRQGLLKQPRQPFGVKIMHPLLQSAAERPCEGRGCSHLCVLAPGPRAVCKCPYGLLLSEDALSCSSSANTAFLLLLAPSVVTQIFLQPRHVTSGLKDWPEHTALQLPGVNQAAILDLSLRESLLFVTDDSTNSLSFFTLRDGGLSSEHQLLKLWDDSITAMAVDWVTLNVYWSSTKQRRIQVTSAADGHTLVVLREGVGRVESIALHPQSGRACFSNLQTKQSGGGDGEATVECADMDGAERRVVWKDAVRPTSLVFSNNGKSIYWADIGLGTISSVQLDDLVYREMKVADGLVAVALNDDTLLWATAGDKTRVWFRDELQENKLWFEVETEVVSLKVFSRSSQKGSNRCSVQNGGCAQLCLPTSGGRSCRCAHDQVPLNASHCAPGQKCPAGSRLCLDQLSCRPELSFCDGQADCPDHSDENCVTVKQRSSDSDLGPSLLAASFPALSTNRSSSLNASEGRWALDLEQCGSSRCGGRGRCVLVNREPQCVCSLLYSGDSCETHLLKKLQQPLIYGAVGLAALAAAIVVLVVFRRKRNDQTRADPPAVKETSLTEIETKVDPKVESRAEPGPRPEPSPAAQTCAAETDPEEVVTPATDSDLREG